MMKQLIPLFLLFCSMTATEALAAGPSAPFSETLTGILSVRILNVRSPQGELVVALFNAQKGFPGKLDTAFRKTAITADGAVHETAFDNVPYGTYAVTVRHDENSNGKLDTNFIGMPEEGVGTSNNPRTRFGPPSFNDARLELDRETMVIEITMKYL
jgi:uncharacterized protein (DUF2141 family)